MKKNFGFIITIIVIILSIILLLIYYFSMNENLIINVSNNFVANNSITNTNTNNSTSNTVQLNLVDDYNIFFNIKDIINKYETSLYNNDLLVTIDILDNYYKKRNNINANNLDTLKDDTYTESTFVNIKTYEKKSNNISYYFVIGNDQRYDFGREIMKEYQDIKYLVIIDNNNKAFSVSPIDSSENLVNYGNKYDIVNTKTIEKNFNNSLITTKYDDERITNYYVAYFKNLIYLDSEKAYSMLSNEYKKSFLDYEDFVKNLASVYNSINTNLFSFAKSKEINGKRVFSAEMLNHLFITFEESNIMDFKVTITK